MKYNQQYLSLLNLIRDCKSLTYSYTLIPLIRMFSGNEFSKLVHELRTTQDNICKRDLNKYNARKKV